MSSRFSERHIQEIVGVLLLAVGALLVVSLLSYDPQDPSLSSVSSDPVVHNLVGKVGAILADTLFQSLGGGAYLLPLGALFFGLRGLLQQIHRITIWRVLGFGLLLLFIPVLLQNVLTAFPSPTVGWILHEQTGGVLGHFLSQWLMEYFNPVGAHIIVFSSLLSGLMMVSSFSPIELVIALVHGGRSIAREAIRLGGTLRNQVRRLRSRSRIRKVVFREKPKILHTPPKVKSEVAHGPSRPKQHTFNFQRSRGPYKLPPLTLLSQVQENPKKTTEQELIANSKILEKKLEDFNIDGRVTQVHPGPVVTLYEFEPAPGIKVNQIVNLSDDLALAMRAMSVRIVAPIPGKSVVGIEIPNTHREDVSLREIIASKTNGDDLKLPLALGKDIFGRPVIADLSTMPHLLVAGATGSGKSVCLNSMILSLLFSLRPDEVKFILIDPKLLELSVYEEIPHLLTPVVVKAKDSPAVFSHLVNEMQTRYRLLAEAGVRSIEAYNNKIEEALIGSTSSGEDHSDPMESEVKEPKTPLPYLIVVVDELADLMAVASREIEDSIARLAQMARAAGIHLVVATQRPSVDVLTGTIKANFPARIAFQVSSKTDSRTILDANGAEQLLGKGDMLFISPGSGRMTRIHGAYVSEVEIAKVVNSLKAQAQPQYAEIAPNPSNSVHDGSSGTLERDNLYEKAVDIISHSGIASASLIQRRLRVGYPRAARMIEMMEEDGIVGPASGAKPREVLTPRFDEGESS